MPASDRAEDPMLDSSGGCSPLAGMAWDPGMSGRVGLMHVSTTGSDVLAASAGACSSLAGMASAAGDSDKAAEDGPPSLKACRRTSRFTSLPECNVICSCVADSCSCTCLSQLLLPTLHIVNNRHTRMHSLQW